jgi:hypothetical protein
MDDQPYPHRRNDCYCCGEFDADMAVRYESLAADIRWCQRCAGAQLARLVSVGHTVAVRSLDASDVKVACQARDASWTIDLAEEILRKALPSASVFLRALISEGGRATAQRLRELTSGNELRAMT